MVRIRLMSLPILFCLLGAASAHAATPVFAFCFAYGHGAQDGIRVSQVLSFQSPETSTDILARLATRQTARGGDESGCSVSPSLAAATEERAAFIADGGHARMLWLRGIAIKEVTVDTSGLEDRDGMYLADAEAEANGKPMYLACYLAAGPGKQPVMLASPFLSSQDGVALIRNAMLTVPAYDRYTSPVCQSHANKEMASEFLKEGVALAATYGVQTAELKISGQ